MQDATGSLIFLVLMIAIFYFLLFRPQQRMRQQQQRLQASLELGDEVVTIGGFVGTIRRFDGDMLYLEIAPNVQARVGRWAVRAKVTKVEEGSGEGTAS